MTWKWWWKTVQKIWWVFFFIRYFYLSFNEFSCLILPCLLRSKNGHTSFQNMTFLFLSGSLNRLVIKCSKVYLRIWLYSLDKCNNKTFKTWVRLSQKNFTLVPVSQSFVQIRILVVPMYEFFCLIRSENGDLHFKTWLFYSVQFIEQCVLGNFNSHVFKFFFYLLHKYFWGESILHISTEIWIKEWSVFDGFGTTCCYCLCLNNSLLNHCMRRFSQRQDATQKVTEFIGFHENHLISILGTIVSVCNTVDVLWCQPIKLIHVVSTSEFHEYWWNDVDFIPFT